MLQDILIKTEMETSMSQLTEKTRLEGVLRRFIRDYLPQTNDGKVSFVKADGTRADVDVRKSHCLRTWLELLRLSVSPFSWLMAGFVRF